MEWFYVISLILLGIGLILVEVIFVPGTTIVGILGLIASIYGIYLGYDYFGNTAGNWILTVSGVIGLGVMVYAFRSNAWDRFSLKSTSQGKFNDEELSIKTGDKGVALSTLKPIGKVEFNNKTFEAKTLGDYVNPGAQVKIIKIEGNKITVEPF